MGMSWAAPLISSCMENCMLRWVVEYEALCSPALGFLRLLLVSRIIVVPMNVPMADRPMTRMKAGRRTAHSRGGNHACMGLDASKNGTRMAHVV